VRSRKWREGFREWEVGIRRGELGVRSGNGEWGVGMGSG
jgi:hypothetical protein